MVTVVSQGLRHWPHWDIKFLCSKCRVLVSSNNISSGDIRIMARLDIVLPEGHLFLSRQNALYFIKESRPLQWKRSHQNRGRFGLVTVWDPSRKECPMWSWVEPRSSACARSGNWERKDYGQKCWRSGAYGGCPHETILNFIKGWTYLKKLLSIPVLSGKQAL